MSTDLLIVGGPTDLRRMTTDSGRNRHISRQKQAQAKGGAPHELEPEAGDRLREWFTSCGRRKGGAMPPLSTLASVPCWPARRHGIGRKLRVHGYELVTNPPIWARVRALVTNPEGFILDDAYGPLRAGEIERAKEWGAQLVRTSVARPEGWAIWESSRATSSPTRGGRSPVKQRPDCSRRPSLTRLALSYVDGSRLLRLLTTPHRRSEMARSLTLRT